MVTNFKLMGLVYASKSFSGLSTLLEYFIPRSLAERRVRNFKFVRDVVMQRIESQSSTTHNIILELLRIIN